MAIERTGLTVVVLALLTGLVSAGCAAGLSAEEQLAWVRYTVPLPKSIEIAGSIEARVGSVAIEAPVDKDIVIEEAVKQLRELVGKPEGKPGFTVEMKLKGEDLEPLSLKNSDQAYRIFPVGSDRLKLVALSPRGLFYAARTLAQLIAGKLSGATIRMPLVTVTDWPDMEDRGLWGSDNYDHLKWLGDRKMNIVEQISDQGVRPNGEPYARLKSGRERMVTEGPRYGINPVPATLHLEQVAGKGIFAAYPNLKAKSEKESAWCYSQPQAPVIIAGWLEDLTRLPHVNEVDVWMAENMNMLKGCQCEKCAATGVDPMVLEARAIFRGWELARRRTGKNIGLRILTSEATEDFNQQIFVELPKGVKVNYYHSLLTYTSGRSPMLFRPYLAEFAKDHWLGVCPNISPVIGWTQPLTSAQFIHYRMDEFISKGVRGLIGYATPRVHFVDYVVEAAAEYTWNVKGRSTREFAASYAVRNRIADPEKFAEFAEAVGEVEWSCYGSDWPSRAENWIEDPIDVRLKNGTVPELGYVKWDFLRAPFGAISTEKQLADNVALAARAVKLADELGIERYKCEARIAQGYILSIQALYGLKQVVRDGKIAESDRPAAAKLFQAYVDALRQSNEAMPGWEKSVARRTDPVGNTDKPIKTITRNLIEPMIALAKELGVEVR